MNAHLCGDQQAIVRIKPPAKWSSVRLKEASVLVTQVSGIYYPGCGGKVFSAEGKDELTRARGGRFGRNMRGIGEF